MAKLGYEEIARLVSANNRSGASDFVLIAQSYKESGFDPVVKSKAANSSATGLLGITRTALNEVNRVKKTAYQHATMTTAATNILVGSTYLSICLSRKGGSLSAALDYYGTGPGYSKGILAAAKRLPDSSDPMRVLVEEIGKR